MPESFLSRKKIYLLVMAMDAYVQKNKLNLEVRFDFITYLVENGTWTRDHVNDAFYPFITFLY